MLSSKEQAETILRSQPGVGEIIIPQNGNGGASSSVGTELEVDFIGDEESVAVLLETLIQNKVRVSSFTETHTGLEEVFLRLTKGEVQ